MFTERLRDNWEYNEPIFTSEILETFPEFTRAYVFRLIKAAEAEGSLARLDTGIYYLPRVTPFGMSTITPAEAAYKRYIKSGDEVYGIYGGLTLLNTFNLTTQMTNIPEIITNRETTRCRQITICNMPFLLRRARTEITAKNAAAYTVLQLLSDIDRCDINEMLKATISRYINENNVRKDIILALTAAFPAKTAKNLLLAEVL